MNDAAKDISEKSIKLFGEDVITNGEAHEYYPPDTDEGVNNMIVWYDGSEYICEF